MRNGITLPPRSTIGLDVGDRVTHGCEIDGEGTVVRRFSFPTTPEGVEKGMAVSPTRVVLEAGTHSPWMSRRLKATGHEVIVANPARVRLISASDRKTDRHDAEALARLGRTDPTLLHPIQHRGGAEQAALETLRGRDALVRARTLLINHVRGACKSWGTRLPSSSSGAFAAAARRHRPAELGDCIDVVCETLETLTKGIRALDKKVEALGETFKETKLLRQVKGVGAVTSLAYVLTLGSPARFRRSRHVGGYLGLQPGLAQSGDRNPQMPITKAGDGFLRRLLIGAAHYILGPFGKDCQLRRAGQRLMTSGGARAKKRAVVAVARKLAVLLHHLWKTAVVYEPLHGQAPTRTTPATPA